MTRVLLLALALAPAAAFSTTLRVHTVQERAVASERVALVQVVSREVRADGPRNALKTFTRVVVGEDYKGRGPAELTVVQLGGVRGDVDARIPGDADFTPGETAVVFLRCRSPERCTLVAMGEGKLPVVAGQALVRDLATGRVTKTPLRQLPALLLGRAGGR